MAEKISIETSDLEVMIGQSVHITQLSADVSAKMTTIAETIPSLSSNGSFHKLIGNSSSNGGLTLFSLKAKEFLTLSEVFAQHIQNTYEKMVDVDRAIAVYVTEMTLNDPSESVEVKEYIRSNPEEAVRNVQAGMKGEYPQGGQE